MELIITVVALLVLAVVVGVVAVAMPERMASRGHWTSHSELDQESEAFRNHQPGGNTGGSL